MIGSRKQKHAIKVLTSQVDALRAERHAHDDGDTANLLGVALFALSSELRHRSTMLQDYSERLNEGIDVLGESPQHDPRVTNALSSMLAWRAWLHLQTWNDRSARESAEACAALLQNAQVTDVLDPVGAAESLVTSSRVLSRCDQHEASLELARLAEAFAAEADQPAEFERLTCTALLARSDALEAAQDHYAALSAAHEAVHHAGRAFSTDASGQNAYASALSHHAAATIMANEQGASDALPFAQAAADWFERAASLKYKTQNLDHAAALTTLMRVHLALDNQREARSHADETYNSLGYRAMRTSDFADLQSRGQALVSTLIELGKTRDAQFLAKVINKRTGAPS